MHKSPVVIATGAGELSSGLIKLFPKDYFWLTVLGIFSLVVFINAQDDFSYDYRHYIKYFEDLGGIELSDLIDGIYNSFPIPYVMIPPTGSFELGFGLLVWLLMQIFGKASLVYAIIGSISIAVRFWVLRKMGLGWGWLIIVNVYAITLFESNAIRLGCAITLFLYGLLLICQRNSIFYIGGIFVLACLFHFQLLFQIFFFLLIYLSIELIVKSKISLIGYILVILIGTLLVREFQESFGFGKYVDYIGVTALAGGFNVVTSLALMVVGMFLVRMFPELKNSCESRINDREVKVWFAASMVIIPALVVYILLNNMGAVGDRVWQMAFIIFASIAFAKISKQRNNRIEIISLFLLILVATINVIYRYPLSNFFYPLSPYVEIDSTFPIL